MNIDELCYKVIGAGMAVHRHFGAGYLEEVYKNAMMVELGDVGLQINFGGSSLQHKHKYRVYRSSNSQSSNPVNPANPV